jgi:hypothetical protein
VAKIAFQVYYNARTFRWEVWRAGDRLSACTHPSKEFAVLSALGLLRDQARGRLVVYNEQGDPETLLQAQDCRGTRPANRPH